MKKNILLFLIVSLIVALPIIYGGKTLYIGGDTIIPFGAENLQIYFSQWIERQNGEYFFHSFYFYYALFALFDWVTSDIYIKGVLLLLTIRVIAVFGVIKLIKLLYGERFSVRSVLGVSFYLLSPAYYNGHVYWLAYAFIPWLIYFVIKIIKNKKINYSDILLINIVLLGSSADLPNPKYLFHAFLIIGISLVVATFFGKIDRKFYSENKYKIVLVFVLSSYLFVPLTLFALNYDPADYGGVGIKHGYVNDSDAAMMDFRSATPDRMMRLFNNAMNIAPAVRAEYLSNPLVIISNISFIFLIAFYFFFKRKDKDVYDYLLLILLVVYLFFAIGPNPPFGLLYEYIVALSPIFGFLRTTAGAVFYLSLLYSLLIVSALRHFKKTYLYLLCTAFFLITVFPMIDGSYYKNWNPVNSYIDKDSYGLKIPEKYFQLKDVIDTKKLDAKIYVPRSDMSYINTTWGYFGPAGFYNTIYKGSFIGNDKIYSSDIGIHNVGYIFFDRTLISDVGMEGINSEDMHALANNEIGAVYGMKDGTFLPRIYILPRMTFAGERHVSKLDEASVDVGSLVPELSQKNRPVVEYKKISPTKYRILLHGIKEDFMLVLSEQFSKLWSIDVVEAGKIKQQKFDLDGLELHYKILANNENEQAHVGELKEFIKQGWITTVGDGVEKEIEHYSYSDTAKHLKFVEKYVVDFISKKNYDTIQNNNLDDEDIRGVKQEAMRDIPHVKVNQYANAWIFRKDYLEQQFTDYLVRREDGKIDMEIIVEFLPQRVLYYSLVISFISLFLTIVLAIREKINAKSQR